PFAAGQASAQSRGEKDEAPRQENPEYRYDFGLFGDGHFFTSEHILGRSKDDPSTPPEVSPKSSGAFGAHLGFHVNRWIGIEGEAVGIPTRTRGVNSLLDPPSDTQLWVFGYRASFILHLSDNYIVQPFLLAGYGGLTSLSGNSDVVRGDTVGFLHGGAGLKIGFTPWIGLRLDGRILVPWTALSPAIPIGSRIGYTGPDFEVFAGLFVNFGEVEKIQIVDRPRPDKDGDGIPDDVDKCPTEPEDKDGFQDDDGCPDPDNDGDGIPDALDKCPNDPEDKDGFQDDDGCPDLDNDGDGIPDINDACPNEKEDGKGKRPNDGCPSSVEDSDGDGIPDVRDKCPDEPEDKDGFQDDDGCPDYDNDGDGIPDAYDACPNEAEDFD